MRIILLLRIGWSTAISGAILGNPEVPPSASRAGQAWSTRRNRGSGPWEITSQASPGTPLRRPLVNNLDVCRSGPYDCSSNPASMLDRMSKCCGFSHHHHSCQAFRLAGLHLERDPKRSSPPHFTPPTRASRSGLKLHPHCIQDRSSLIQPWRSPLFERSQISASTEIKRWVSCRPTCAISKISGGALGSVEGARPIPLGPRRRSLEPLLPPNSNLYFGPSLTLAGSPYVNAAFPRKGCGPGRRTPCPPTPRRSGPRQAASRFARRTRLKHQPDSIMKILLAAVLGTVMIAAPCTTDNPAGRGIHVMHLFASYTLQRDIDLLLAQHLFGDPSLHSDAHRGAFVEDCGHCAQIAMRRDRSLRTKIPT